jgi:HEAT repeat protein
MEDRGGSTDPVRRCGRQDCEPVRAVRVVVEIFEELRSEFDKDDDVDYAALAQRLGPRALPALADLVAESDRAASVASRATYLAGLIKEPIPPDMVSPLDVVSRAAGSQHTVVRVAAAFTLTTLPEGQTLEIAERLLSDPDARVRARAVRSAAHSSVDSLVQRVQKIAKRDPEQWVQKLAADLLDSRDGSQR